MIVPFTAYLSQLKTKPSLHHFGSPRSWCCAALLFLLTETTRTFYSVPRSFCADLEFAFDEGRIFLFVDPAGLPISFYLLNQIQDLGASLTGHDPALEEAAVILGACARGSFFQTAGYFFANGHGNVLIRPRRSGRKKVFRPLSVRSQLVSREDLHSLDRAFRHQFGFNPVTSKFFESTVKAFEIFKFIAASYGDEQVDIVKMFAVLSFFIATGQYALAYDDRDQLEGVLLWGFLTDELSRANTQDIWWSVPPHHFSFGPNLAMVALFGRSPATEKLEREFRGSPPMAFSEVNDRVRLITGRNLVTQQVISF